MWVICSWNTQADQQASTKEVFNVTLKGVWNEKNRFEENRLERTFGVLKIGLYSCRVSHFSLEIFEFVSVPPP